jgi:hypothetical protein
LDESGQLLDESSKHPFDFDGIRGELFMKGCLEDLKVSWRAADDIQFAGRTAGDGAEAGELRVTAPSAALGEFPALAKGFALDCALAFRAAGNLGCPHGPSAHERG